MVVRLIRDTGGYLKLLCKDGSIATVDSEVLVMLLRRFKSAQFHHGNAGYWNTECEDMALYPGTTLSCVNDVGHLVIIDPTPFIPVLTELTERIEAPNNDVAYLSTHEYAKKVDKSPDLIKTLCRQGRIQGAKKIGNRWAIPKDEPYPIPPERVRDYRFMRKENRNKDYESKE